jgi:hypothetical protein
MSKFTDRFTQEIRWARYKVQVWKLGLNDPRGTFTGLLSQQEGITLFKLVRKLLNNAVIVEIGCYGGLSSAYLLEGAKKGAFLYSIDPFDSDIDYLHEDESNVILADKKFSAEEVEAKLKTFGFKNFELKEGFSFDIVRNWNRPIDLLWIDGNHDYQAVKQDYEQWEPFIKIGGFIAFHDSNKKDNSHGWSKWGWEGPTRLVREVLRPPKWSRVTRNDSITYAKKTV